MNKFKKPSKSKSLTLGIAILSSAAIVSTGFAAWVITGGAEASVSGTIEADTVERKDHTIAIAANLEPFYFGAPEKMDNANAWLRNNGATKEKLVITTTFTVANVETEPTNANIGDLIDGTKTKFEETTTTEANKYSAAANAGYVAKMPTIVALGSTETTAVGVYINPTPNSYTAKTATFDLKIVFGWGDNFKHNNINENPYLYYNRLTATEENKKAAETSLGAIHNINASFKLTLVTK